MALRALLLPETIEEGRKTIPAEMSRYREEIFPPRREEEPIVARYIDEIDLPKGRVVGNYRSRCKGGVESSFNLVPWNFDIGDQMGLGDLRPKMDLTLPTQMGKYEMGKFYRVIIVEEE